MPEVSYSEYKDAPMIVLRRKPEDKYPFQFGFGKAKLITQFLPEIIAWVKKLEDEARAKDEAQKKGEAVNAE